MSKTLKEKVEAALDSPKVDTYIKFHYNARIGEDPNMDLSKSYVQCLARGVREGLKAEGISGGMGDIYSIRTPYSKFPDLVNNPDFIRFGR